MTNDAALSFQKLSHHTVAQVLDDTAQRLPDKTALIYGDVRVTFAELAAESRRLRDALAGLGIGKGTMVAVYMPNSVELYSLFYALQRLGAVIAWLNPSYRETEVRFILQNSGAKAIFLLDAWQGFDYLGCVLNVKDVPDLQHVVAVPRKGESWPTDSRLYSFEDLRKGSKQPETTETVHADDLSMLIYTSGTTGRPKGAMITQSQAVRAGWAYSLGVNANEEDVFIGFLAMSHSYGCGALLVQPVLLGSTVVVLDQFSPEKAFQLIQKERVTLQLGSPAHYIMELNHPSRKDYDLSSVRAGLIAGQIAPAGLISRVEQEMGIYISSFLGSSEVGPGLSIILPYSSPLEFREKYIGYPLPDTSAKVVDPATGLEQTPGEPGELLLSGWHVTQGYWRNPEETSRQIVDGWLHTGDLVARDPNDCFRILGRIKDFINRGGFKVIPSEVESLIVQHPKVVETCVVGTPNPILGESICACVKLAENAGEMTLKEIRSFLEGKVAPFKLPDELLIVSDFPRLSGGLKVNRFGAGGVMDLAKSSTEKQVYHR